MYSSHLITQEKGKHIIGRQDPITGDIIKENDRVVFCKACQSAFLVESWEYMNKTHCEQQETLPAIPAPNQNLVAKKKTHQRIGNERLDFEMLGTDYTKMLMPILMGGLSPFITNIITSDSYYWVSELIAVLAVFGVVIFAGVKIIKIENVRKFLRVGKNDIRIFDSGIEVKNKFYRYGEIERITYLKEYVNFYQQGGTRFLVVKLKNGETIRQKISPTTYMNLKGLMFALANKSSLVDIDFDLGDEGKEYDAALNLQADNTGNISVNPLRLE